MPDEREELMIAVRDGKRASRDSSRRGVGMGSREQVLGEDFMMTSLTVASETGWKVENGTPAKESDCDRGECTAWESRSLLIFIIFSVKNVEKRSGRDDRGKEVGR